MGVFLRLTCCIGSDGSNRRYGNLSGVCRPWLVYGSDFSRGLLRVPRRREARQIAEVMATKPEREYTVIVTIGTSHAGLTPVFQRLEDALVHMFARTPEARKARDLVLALTAVVKDLAE